MDMSMDECIYVLFRNGVNFGLETLASKSGLVRFPMYVKPPKDSLDDASPATVNEVLHKTNIAKPISNQYIIYRHMLF